MNSKVKIVLITLGFLFFVNFLHSQSQVDSLKGLLKETDGKEKLKLLIKIGYYLSSENPTEAIKYLDEAIQLADRTQNEWNKADAFFNKGVALWHLGEISKSDSFYEQAISIYEAFNDSLSLIKVFNSQAINHQMRGSVDLAFETFLKSLDYAKKVGDKPTIFNTILNIGIMYDNNKDFDRCLKYYFEAMQYSDQIDKASLALLQSYIAEVYITLKNYEKAEPYLQKAVLNSKLSGDTKSLIWSYSNLGYIELSRKNFEKAETYFLESLKLSRRIDYKLQIIHSLTDLGIYYNQSNSLNFAEKYLTEALNLASEMKSLSNLKIIYQELSLLNAKKQNYENAYNFHQKYKEISDSLYVISNKEMIAEIETRLDLKQKERETQLLKNENELQRKIISSQKIIALVISLLAIASIIFIWLLLKNRNKILKTKDLLLIKNEEIENNQIEISEKNEVLAGLNATKDKFFSIIAHDLRNPIAAYVNISDMLEQDYDRLSESDKKEIIGQMNISSKNLIRLLENLLTWARLSSNKIDVYNERVLFSDLVEASVYPYLQSAQNKKIRLSFNIPGGIVINTDKFIFQTIVGNLINNAIKFSNTLSEINTSLVDTNEKYILSIKDHGIGIEESQLRNIFMLGKVSTGKGTMGESGTGLGLVLVKELVDKLGWTIEVKSKVNTGTEFLISIPKSKLVEQD